MTNGIVVLLSPVFPGHDTMTLVALLDQLFV